MTKGLKPKRTECPLCGTWVCRDCDGINPDQSRYSPRPIVCRTCKSPEGDMRPMSHRHTAKITAHNEAAEDKAHAGRVPRYPLVSEDVRTHVSEAEMTYLFRHSSRTRPVRCEWGTGNVLVGPGDFWITQALEKLRS